MESVLEEDVCAVACCGWYKCCLDWHLVFKDEDVNSLGNDLGLRHEEGDYSSSCSSLIKALSIRCKLSVASEPPYSFLQFHPHLSVPFLPLCYLWSKHSFSSEALSNSAQDQCFTWLHCLLLCLVLLYGYIVSSCALFYTNCQSVISVYSFDHGSGLVLYRAHPSSLYPLFLFAFYKYYHQSQFSFHKPHIPYHLTCFYEDAILPNYTLMPF